MKKTNKKFKTILVATPFFVIFKSVPIVHRDKQHLLKSKLSILKSDKQFVISTQQQTAANTSVGFLVVAILISGGFMIANLINNYFFRRYTTSLVPKDFRPHGVRDKKLKFPLPKA